MVDQYDPKWSLGDTKVGQSRFRSAGAIWGALCASTNQTISRFMAIESVWDLFDTVRGDLLLIDRKQVQPRCRRRLSFQSSGILPQGRLQPFQSKLRIVEPQITRSSISNRHGRRARGEASDSYEIDRRELLGDGRQVASKIVGRAVWVGRATLTCNLSSRAHP